MTHSEVKRGRLKRNRKVQNLEVTVQGHRLEVQRIARRVVGKKNEHSAPELVLLHEGLGSISHWKGFPSKLATTTECPIVVYSRYGCGNSDLLEKPREVSYMHDEALKSLPELLTRVSVEAPILIGHSDGASIALIHAAVHNRIRGLVLLAPHVFVEELSVTSITEATHKFETTNLCEKLARHHRDPARTFWGWNNIWLRPEFRRWNIEEYLPRITCPILAIQGFEDQYGTMAQVEAIARQSSGPVEILRLHDCRHSAHRDRPDAVLNAVRRFVRRLV
jgi:pimeloyl-ACP methyl ester carboxylesterase